MSVIDTSGWGEFRVGELFTIRPTKAYKATNIQLFDDGDNPVLANSTLNNGIGGFTSMPTTEDGGIITFSDTTTSEAIFYQPDPFVGYPHVQGMYPIGEFASSWSELSLLFFVAAFKKAAVQRGFDYGDKFTRVLAASLLIKLPVTSTGDPDWGYIESTMRGLMEQQERELNTLIALGETEPQQIDVSGWGEFRLDELFTIVKGARLTTAQRLPGEIPYVGASQFNNGITHYIGNDEKVHPGGVLSVCYNGPVGTTFYQPEPFWATDDVNVLYPKTNVSMEGLLFVAPAIESVGSGYAYIDKWKLTDMQATLIRLPQTAHGNPDWAYMESTMREHIEQREKTVDAYEAFV